MGSLRPPSRASTASLTVAGTSTPGLDSTSVTKKGLPAVAASTAPASAPWAPASSSTAPDDSGFEQQPPTSRGEPAQDPAQRMVVAQLVVPVGQQQHARPDAPGEVADHVQGGVVGPVHVLDHHRGRAGQLLVHGAEHGVPPGPRLHRLGQGAPPAPRAMSRNGPRVRGDQVVAGADEHPGVGRRLPRERPDEARLADPASP